MVNLIHMEKRTETLGERDSFSNHFLGIDLLLRQSEQDSFLLSKGAVSRKACCASLNQHSTRQEDLRLMESTWQPKREAREASAQGPSVLLLGCALNEPFTQKDEE